MVKDACIARCLGQASSGDDGWLVKETAPLPDTHRATTSTSRGFENPNQTKCHDEEKTINEHGKLYGHVKILSPAIAAVLSYPPRPIVRNLRHGISVCSKYKIFLWVHRPSIYRVTSTYRRCFPTRAYRPLARAVNRLKTNLKFRRSRANLCILLRLCVTRG